jgi:hypothetical protein
MTTLKEAMLHCSTQIDDMWWTDNNFPTSLCGAPCERYMDTHGTDWLLCSLPGHFLGDISNNRNPQWVRVNEKEIRVVKCPECQNHPDLPLLALGLV